MSLLLRTPDPELRSLIGEFREDAWNGDDEAEQKLLRLTVERTERDLHHLLLEDRVEPAAIREVQERLQDALRGDF